MKKLIYIIMAIMLLGLVSAATMERTVPGSVGPGDSFSITYTASGISGMWGASIEDFVSGGCTFPSGSNQIKTVMLSEEGLTKTLTMTAGTAGTCVFSGDYKFGEDAIQVFGSDSVTVEGSCTPDCSNNANVCSGSTYDDGCGGDCSGTKDCSSCTGDNSCAANVCEGNVCSDSCGNVYDGTKTCSDGGTPFNINSCIPGTEGWFGDNCLSWLMGIIIAIAGAIILNKL